MPFYHLEDIQEQSPLHHYKIKFLHSEYMTFAYLDIKAGAVLPEHHHVQEQVGTVIAGKFELTIDGETQILRPGSVAIIPSNAVHSGRALTDCWIIESFYPLAKKGQEEVVPKEE